MKVGIDSYCFHRFFGEVYPQQAEPAEGAERPVEQAAVVVKLRDSKARSLDDDEPRVCFLTDR